MNANDRINTIQHIIDATAVDADERLTTIKMLLLHWIDDAEAIRHIDTMQEVGVDG